MHPLIPLLILFLFLIISAVIGFIIYSIATDIASKTSKKMEDHNVSVGKDGLKISMREIKNEDYVDKTQNVLVKAWNLSTWPAYKSRFWNKEEDMRKGKSSKSGKSPRPGASPRGGSSPSPSHTSSSSGRHHEHHSHRTSNGRLAEPRPAGARLVAPSSPVPGAFD